MESIEQLNYVACSRNPNLARGLSYFERIEEQCDGIRRIVRVTAEVGLPRPRFLFRDGHFTVVFPGPGDHILELKSQHAHPVFEVADDVLKNLSETQRSIIQLLLAERKARVPDLADRLGLSQQAIRKALKALKARRLVLQVGKARETAYLLNERQFE